MQLLQINIIGLAGLPEIKTGDDLSSLIFRAAVESGLEITAGDTLVIAQKIVSKSEGRVVRLDSVTPSPMAREWAESYKKDARVVEVVLNESRRIVRMDRGVLVCETRHGFICANAGVDASNVAEGSVVLLPEDPDRSAQRIREGIERASGVRVSVIISDTFGRPWREGLVNVAIGISGLAPLIDYRGQIDTFGRPLQVTVIAAADEIASAAELVMKKSAGIPVAIVRGLMLEPDEGSGRDLIRAAEQDIFR
jgi:coenzyme F420-0:L-glutamate ligase/coenzyme F420-1:gamma-L-glutamate ligase